MGKWHMKMSHNFNEVSFFAVKFFSMTHGEKSFFLVSMFEKPKEKSLKKKILSKFRHEPRMIANTVKKKERKFLRFSRLLMLPPRLPIFLHFPLKSL
jgi:hypothetical protein